MLEKGRILSSRLGGFAYLNMSTQMKNNDAMIFYQNISEKLTDYAKPTVFFSLELNKLNDAKLKQWFKNKDVAFYKPFINRVRKYKKYELSEELEEILLEKSVTSSDAWVRLYEETSSRLVYTVDGKKYNDAEISKLLLDKSADVRHKAGKELNRVAKENAPLFTLIYNMIMKDKAIEDDKRGFKKPVSARNMAEDVKDEVVDTLAATVKDNYRNIAHRFYKLKAKWLGIKKLEYWHDLSLLDDQKYTVEELHRLYRECTESQNYTLVDNKIVNCYRTYVDRQCGDWPKENNDYYIDLNDYSIGDEKLKKRMFDLMSIEYIERCKFCVGTRGENAKKIPVGIQREGVSC